MILKSLILPTRLSSTTGTPHAIQELSHPDRGSFLPSRVSLPEVYDPQCSAPPGSLHSGQVTVSILHQSFLIGAKVIFLFPRMGTSAAHLPPSISK
jgi:hypothetical protein